MAKGARRGGRVRDKWRDKQWLILDSPNSFGDFGGRHINYLPITDTTTAIGRVVENTLFDIKKQDPADHKTKVFVEIENINEGVASTLFKGHEYGKEFLRSLVRRGSSMITHIHNYTTQDGHEFRVEIIAFSQRRINSSKKHELRRVIHNLLSEKIPQWDLNSFIKQVTDDNSDFNREILEKGKRISSLRHIGIKKTKLVSSPKSPIERSTIETESETETEGETGKESETETEGETGKESETETEGETGKESETETEGETGIETENTEINKEAVEDKAKAA